METSLIGTSSTPLAESGVDDRSYVVTLVTDITLVVSLSPDYDDLTSIVSRDGSSRSASPGPSGTANVSADLTDGSTATNNYHSEAPAQASFTTDLVAGNVSRYDTYAPTPSRKTGGPNDVRNGTAVWYGTGSGAANDSSWQWPSLPIVTRTSSASLQTGSNTPSQPFPSPSRSDIDVFTSSGSITFLPSYLSCWSMLSLWMFVRMGVR